MSNITKILIIIGLMAGMLGSKTPPRAWIDAKVLDTASDKQFQGYSTIPGSPYNGPQADYQTEHYYVLETPQRRYVVEQTGLWHAMGGNNHAARIVINGTVRIAVEGDTIYMLDDTGREIKTKILKQVLLPPTK